MTPAEKSVPAPSQAAAALAVLEQMFAYFTYDGRPGAKGA